MTSSRWGSRYKPHQEGRAGTSSSSSTSTRSKSSSSRPPSSSSSSSSAYDQIWTKRWEPELRAKIEKAQEPLVQSVFRQVFGRQHGTRIMSSSSSSSSSSSFIGGASSNVGAKSSSQLPLFSGAAPAEAKVAYLPCSFVDERAALRRLAQEARSSTRIGIRPVFMVLRNRYHSLAELVNELLHRYPNHSNLFEVLHSWSFHSRALETSCDYNGMLSPSDSESEEDEFVDAMEVDDDDEVGMREAHRGKNKYKQNYNTTAKQPQRVVIFVLTDTADLPEPVMSEFLQALQLISRASSCQIKLLHSTPLAPRCSEAFQHLSRSAWLPVAGKGLDQIDMGSATEVFAVSEETKKDLVREMLQMVATDVFVPLIVSPGTIREVWTAVQESHGCSCVWLLDRLSSLVKTACAAAGTSGPFPAERFLIPMRLPEDSPEFSLQGICNSDSPASSWSMLKDDKKRNSFGEIFEEQNKLYWREVFTELGSLLGLDKSKFEEACEKCGRDPEAARQLLAEAEELDHIGETNSNLLVSGRGTAASAALDTMERSRAGAEGKKEKQSNTPLLKPRPGGKMTKTPTRKTPQRKTSKSSKAGASQAEQKQAEISSKPTPTMSNLINPEAALLEERLTALAVQLFGDHDKISFSKLANPSPSALTVILAQMCNAITDLTQWRMALLKDFFDLHLDQLKRAGDCVFDLFLSVWEAALGMATTRNIIARTTTRKDSTSSSVLTTKNGKQPLAAASSSTSTGLDSTTSARASFSFFSLKLSESIPKEEERKGWMGIFEGEESVLKPVPSALLHFFCDRHVLSKEALKACGSSCAETEIGVDPAVALSSQVEKMKRRVALFEPTQAGQELLLSCCSEAEWRVSAALAPGDIGFASRLVEMSGSRIGVNELSTPALMALSYWGLTNPPSRARTVQKLGFGRFWYVEKPSVVDSWEDELGTGTGTGENGNKEKAGLGGIFDSNVAILDDAGELALLQDREYQLRARSQTPGAQGRRPVNKTPQPVAMKKAPASAPAKKRTPGAGNRGRGRNCGIKAAPAGLW
ncbi:unnamed protein product [Amoebophrya sp. A120]|nr:unnamed protein product [Amoebophrya sp. A120]|eukprot:GSA120T00023619001.1